MNDIIKEKSEQIAHCVNRIRLLDERITIADDGRTLVFPDDYSKSEWFEFHRRLVHMRKFLRSFFNQSREYGADKYGVDYVVDVEIQMEMELGIESPDKAERIELNPRDKTKAIVTIEGICQQFTLWQRKMAPEIETWDRPRLEKALALLTPMEEQARRIRERLATPV